jgi:hypothetical protein
MDATPARVSTLSRAHGVAPHAGAWLYGAVVVVLVGFASGGFLPPSWGWAGFACFAIATAALLIRDDFDLGLRAVAFVGPLIAYAAWAGLSAVWSTSVTSSLRDTQRDLAYVAIVVAGVALAARASTALAGGVTTGVVVLSLYALATRVAPGRFTEFSSAAYGYRLTQPLGYWNALGLVAALALLLCLGFAARARSLVTRAAAAATIPALAVTSFFTFSRGSWAAIAIGVLVAVLLDPRRLNLCLNALAAAPFALLGVLAASRKDGLTHVGATLGEARSDGEALTIVLLALCLAAAAVVLAVGVGERRVTVRSDVRRAFAASLVLAALVAGAIGWHTAGSPWQVSSRVWNGLNAPPEKFSPDVTRRLFQLSSSGRLQIWKGAIDGFTDRPLLGYGAGTFWQVWPTKRQQSLPTTQAHSVVFGTLAELGLPGIILLGGALLAPLAAAIRARRRSLVAPLAGAYTAWVFHAAVDWDWQLLAVGAAGLLLATALVVESDRAQVRRLPLPLAFASVAGAALMFYALLGDRALASANRSIRDGEPAAALASLQRASRLQPWSSEPDAARASVELMRGHGALAARRLEQAIAKDPSSWTLWQRLAQVSTGSTRAHALDQVGRLNPHP